MQNLQEQMGSFEIGLRVVNWEILILGAQIVLFMALLKGSKPNLEF